MLNVAERLMDKAQAAIKKIANMSALQIGQLPIACGLKPRADAFQVWRRVRLGL
jgi:hypothetical protein